MKDDKIEVYSVTVINRFTGKFIEPPQHTTLYQACAINDKYRCLRFWIKVNIIPVGA